MSLDAAIEDLERARPGWKWSVSDYRCGHATAFLHYPDGEGCAHADAETPAAAIHAVLAKVNETNWHEQRQAEIEKRERAEYERLKAKYDPPNDLPTPARSDVGEQSTEARPK